MSPSAPVGALARGLACLLTCAFAPTLAAAAPDPEVIDRTVGRALETFHVPGMTVAVVQDGALMHAGGHGVTGAGGDPVDAGTLFQIGSVSKAFTAAALAVLADEGRLTFDDRVIDHLPGFRMHDPWVTREFTLRDLLTHRSGLPLGAGDLLIFPEGNATREEIIHALRYLEPTSSFRSRYDYDNLLYIVAGEVVARVSGKSFEAFVEERLFAPLGMDDCRAALSRVPDGVAVATPHVRVDGELHETGPGLGNVTAPAGGITCSARSMARWMQFVLDRGVIPGGERLIGDAGFAELLAPVTLLPVPAYLAEHTGAFLNAYALGWNVSTFHGEPMYAHGGAVWGMTSFLMLLPEQRVGIFASGNQMSAAPRAVVNAIAEAFLADTGKEGGRDWIAIIDEVAGARRHEGAVEVAEAAAGRAADSTPSLPLEAYAGVYRDPWYGQVHITLEGGRLAFRSERNPPLHGPLEHFQYDTFIARWTDRRLMADAYVSFSLSPEGEVERIRMKAVSPTTDFSYDFHDLDLRRVR